jgi:hypothetical protein
LTDDDTEFSLHVALGREPGLVVPPSILLRATEVIE